MKEISEDDAYKLAGGATEFPVIVKEEDERTESAVTLKKFPTGFILGVSCDSIDKFKLFFSEDFATIDQLCQNFLTTLKEKGNPFLDNGMSKEELKELAAQLGKPDGQKGIQVGQMMNESNISMTRKAWEQLSLNDSEQILELGHGNANHLAELHSNAKNLRYSGLDISELMKQESEKYCAENHLAENATFGLYDGTNIPFSDNAFDKIFTVNTIYFWQQPIDLMNELNRVLKPSGTLCIAFTDEETMNQLTFTEFGFTKYNQDTFKKLIDKCSMEIVTARQYSEMIKIKMLGEVERKYWVMTLKKGTNS